MFSTVWNTQRFRELGREERGKGGDRVELVKKREGGDRGDLMEKKEGPKGERALKPAILLPSKNGY